MNSTNYGILVLTEYEMPRRVGSTRGVAAKGLVSMRDNDTPTNNLIPYGYCHCGCGEKAPLARQSDTKRGWVKGEPVRFLPFHRQRMSSQSQITWSVEDNCYHVHLSSTGDRTLVALIDTCDLEVVSGKLWRANYSQKTGSFYADHSRYRRKPIRMQRLIMDAPDGMVVDHINGDTLDNRRSNLRVATVSENNSNKQGAISRNTSGFMGVHKSSNSTWISKVTFGGNSHRAQGFRCPVEAAIFRDVMALEVQGEFASLNFPELREVLGYE